MNIHNNNNNDIATVCPSSSSSSSCGLVIVACAFLRGMDHLMRDATLVLSHAGAGTILECLGAYTANVSARRRPYSSPFPSPTSPYRYERGDKDDGNDADPHPLLFVVPNRSLMNNHQCELAEKLHQHEYLYCSEVEEMAARLRRVRAKMEWKEHKLVTRWRRRRDALRRRAAEEEAEEEAARHQMDNATASSTANHSTDDDFGAAVFTTGSDEEAVLPPFTDGDDNSREGERGKQNNSAGVVGELLLPGSPSPTPPPPPPRRCTSPIPAAEARIELEHLRDGEQHLTRRGRRRNHNNVNCSIASSSASGGGGRRGGVSARALLHAFPRRPPRQALPLPRRVFPSTDMMAVRSALSIPLTGKLTLGI